MIQPEMHYFRHHLGRAIRGFFDQRGYVEVFTPVLVRCPGIDPHIDAIAAGESFYLATSPELHMKRLLGCGLKKIYQLTHAFRSDEIGKYHNCEFSILEWYETGINYQDLMELTENLIQTVDRQMAEYLSRKPLFSLPFARISVDEAFEQHAGWCPSREWDEERFFLDLIEQVEPALQDMPAFFLYDFPAPMASLARLKPQDPKLSERFELYLKGVEIVNGFSELTCAREQRERFERDRARRIAMNKEPYPLDQHFLSVLEKGLLPDCAGAALGVDRLLMTLTGAEQISQVMAFPLPQV